MLILALYPNLLNVSFSEISLNRVILTIKFLNNILMNVIIRIMKNTKKRKLKIGNLIIVVVGVCLVVGIIIMMIISKFTKTETNEPHERMNILRL